ncbi:MAG: glycosyl hydrolase family 32 [Armatimonadota bacterium]|nr:glycosyl hydrolase family 32 [Armatimonadota bacterium]
MPLPTRRMITHTKKTRRLVLTSTIVVAAIAGVMLMPLLSQAAEVLYNGIRLPSPWPPKDHKVTLDPPAPAPYLLSPPAVIPIDVGRQLFVDNFLIEKTSLRRVFHPAKYHAVNPVVKPDKPWENEGPFPSAMVFSDGVWFDPHDRLFKMWYMGGYLNSICLATSGDGIHWTKPVFDVRPGTNVVHTANRDSTTIWLDLEEKDPSHRYKLMHYLHPGGTETVTVHYSPDGIHWGDAMARSGPCGDRSTIFRNPFRKVWVYSIRAGTPEVGRCREYWETRDLAEGAKWNAGEPTLWVGADRLDPRRADLDTQPQLYNLDCVAYESLMIGLFTIWRGQGQDRAKPNDIAVGFSRDGFNWDRPSRKVFIPLSERYGDWNWGNIQSAGGCCLVVGDKLYFYVSGRAGVQGSRDSGVCGTGLAVLRRDGFASMAARGAEGALTTRPVTFSGKHLFVNADVDGGELRAEALDRNGKVIPPFTRANCVAVKADKTLQQLKWKGAKDLARLAGKPVRFRFYLRNGELYSFWVSPDQSGASRGYVAAGGPGFTGPADTVGSAAYRAAAGQ